LEARCAFFAREVDAIIRAIESSSLSPRLAGCVADLRVVAVIFDATSDDSTVKPSQAQRAIDHLKLPRLAPFADSLKHSPCGPLLQLSLTTLVQTGASDELGDLALLNATK